MDNQSVGILASALTGGLAGAAFTLTAQWITRFWRKPRIQILFDAKEPGCLIDTNVVGQTGSILRFVRLKVKNSGRSTALGVTVCTTELTFDAPGTGSRIFSEDVIDLQLAYERPSPFALAPGAHRFVDVAYVQREPLTFFYVFRPEPSRLRERGFGNDAGTFGAKIFVSAENANAAERFVRWSWDGKFPGLEIR